MLKAQLFLHLKGQYLHIRVKETSHEENGAWIIIIKQINFLKKATVLIMLLIHCVVESRWCWKNGNCPIQSGMPKNCDAIFQWMGGNICQLIFNTLVSVDFFVVKPACTCLTRTYLIRVSSTCHVHYWVSWKQIRFHLHHYTGQTDLKVDSLSFLTLINKVQSHSLEGLWGLCFQDTHALPAYGLLSTCIWTSKSLLLPGAHSFKMGQISLISVTSVWLVLFWSRFFSSSIAITGQS